MNTFIKGVNSIELFSIGGASLLSFLIGDWSYLMAALLTVQVVDIATGVMKGGKVEDVGSRPFFKGLKKKAGMWMLVILANMIDQIAFNDTPVVVSGALGFLIAGEGLSITENLAAIGVNIPPAITKYLSQLKEKNDTEEFTPNKEESDDSE